MKIWSWRAAIQSAKIPSTTKLVLFNLSVYMNELGQSCYPSIKQQASDTGLTERSVTEHLRVAEQAGFIITTKETYKGQGWLRNTYAAAYPKEFTEQIPEPCSPLERSSKIPEPGSGEYLNHVPTNSSYNSPLNTPIPPTPKKPTLPDWIPISDWKDFCEFRAGTKFTARAKQLTIAKLDKLRQQGHDPGLVLQQSIMHGWKGVFELKGTNHARTNDTRKLTGAAALAALHDAAAEQVARERGENLDLSPYHAVR
jgi:hypothetical protein